MTVGRYLRGLGRVLGFVGLFAVVFAPVAVLSDLWGLVWLGALAVLALGYLIAPD